MLDLFFRKYAWTANLALLFATAWLAARTVNTFVGALIRPRPEVDLAATAAPPPRPQLPASLDTVALYRLIGQQPPSGVIDLANPGATLAPPAPPTPRNCDDAGANPVKSDLRMQLVAGVIADRPRFSLATVNDVATRETHVLGVGDQLGAVRLLGVERVRDDRDATGNGFKVVAIICNGTVKEYLDFEPGAGGTPEAGPPNLGTGPVPPPRAPGAAMAGIRKLADNRYEIERGVLDSTLGDLNKVATQARIVPSFKNGTANGFKLFSIQPGSLYASIGIENGDVVQRVNGYEMNSPEKALELYQKLKESGHVTIELERGGQVIRKEYNISGP